MTRDEFNDFCASLPQTTHVVQWGNADVWKVGGKVFAVGGWADGVDAFTFKAGDIAWEVLRDQPGIRPAPYLASRGMSWIQRTTDETMSDEELLSYIRDSYTIVGRGLTKKLQRELGLLTE